MLIVLTDIFFFTLPVVLIFLIKYDVSKPALLPSSGKETTYTGEPLRYSYYQPMGLSRGSPV